MAQITDVDDIDLDDDDLDGEDGGDQSESSVIRKLRRENRQLKAFKKQNAPRLRQLAFTDAGVDLNTREGKLLAKAYGDGELDPDAIRKFAKDELDWELSPPDGDADGDSTEPRVTDEQRQRLAGQQQTSTTMAATKAADVREKIDQKTFNQMLRAGGAEAQKALELRKSGLVDMNIGDSATVLENNANAVVLGR